MLWNHFLTCGPKDRKHKSHGKFGELTMSNETWYLFSQKFIQWNEC